MQYPVTKYSAYRQAWLEIWRYVENYREVTEGDHQKASQWHGHKVGCDFGLEHQDVHTHIRLNLYGAGK